MLNSLSNAEKYDLLTNHVKPEEDVSKTPKPRRKFCTSWLTKYPWMVYSYIMSGAYCLPCALFALWKHQRGQLVVKPFQNLKKMVEKANSHAVSKYHLDAIEMAYTFVQQRKDPSSTVACKLDTKRAENVRQNNVAIPFLDHIVTNLDVKFDGTIENILCMINVFFICISFLAFSKTAALLLSLTPAVMCSEEIDISDVITMYYDDLPSPELIQPELRRWRML